MKTVPEYLAFAVVSMFINPVFGLVATVCSVFSHKANKQGHEKNARMYSDMSFGFAFFGILTSVMIVVEVYAFGLFPENAYYNHTQLIYNT